MKYVFLIALLLIPLASATPCNFALIETINDLDVRLDINNDELYQCLGIDPFGINDKELEIRWGDGTSQPLLSGTDIGDEISIDSEMHTYDSYGDYTITLAGIIVVQEGTQVDWDPIRNPDGSLSEFDTIEVYEQKQISLVSQQDLCDQDACVATTSACLCGGEVATAGAFCYGNTIHEAEDIDQCPATTLPSCQPNDCSAQVRACSCDGVSVASNTYCYEDNTTGTEPLSCGTDNTNIIVADGNLHLCGTQWEQPIPDIITHELCAEVTNFRDTYTCVVNSSGYWWMTRPLPFINGSNVSEYEPQLDGGMYACADGELQNAVVKYSPPPNLEVGACAEDRCYADEGTCMEPGDNVSGYQCRLFDDGAWWVSRLIITAEELINYSSGNYILNCGPKEFSLNVNDESVEANLGYCQLAEVSGGEVGQIFIGIGLDPQTEYSLNKLEEELLALDKDPEELGCLTDQSIACPGYASFNNQTGVFIFTNEDSLQAGPVMSVFNWIRNFFTTNTQVELRSRSASHLYINTDANIQSTAEYVVESECVNRREILGSQSECFANAKWRGVIQSR